MLFPYSSYDFLKRPLRLNTFVCRSAGVSRFIHQRFIKISGPQRLIKIPPWHFLVLFEVIVSTNCFGPSQYSFSIYESVDWYFLALDVQFFLFPHLWNPDLWVPRGSALCLFPHLLDPHLWVPISAETNIVACRWDPKVQHSKVRIQEVRILWAPGDPDPKGAKQTNVDKSGSRFPENPTLAHLAQ